MTKIFKERKTVEQVEEGNELAPKFDEMAYYQQLQQMRKAGMF